MWAGRRCAIDQLYSIGNAQRIEPVAAVGDAGRLARLPILILNLHSRCNCRCVMCDIWQRQESEELQAMELERHRRSLVSLGVRQVVLSGGEPLLNRQLEAICGLLRELGIRVTLLTTGLLLQPRARLIASSVDEVILSLDGPAAIHDAIRRIPRAFETIARGVATLRELRPALPITARTTVQRQNHRFLQETVAAAHELGLDGISFLPADLTSSAFNRSEEPWSAERREQIGLSTQEIEELEQEIEELIARRQEDLRTGFIAEGEAKLRRIAIRFREHVEATAPKSPVCNAPWISAVMEVDGSLRPCFFHPATASTAKMTLEEALNSPPARAFRSQLAVESNPICHRCVCSLNYQDSQQS